MNQSYTKSLKVANFKDKSCDIVEYLSIDNQVLNQKAINSIVVIEKFINFAFGIYGRGTTSYQAARAKIFGAGYELFIITFFIGLYFDQTKPLIEDKAKIKSFGQPIQYWGNQENRLGRKSYGEIRQFMFAALVAKTDIDLIALDKDEITARKVVD